MLQRQASQINAQAGHAQTSQTASDPDSACKLSALPDGRRGAGGVHALRLRLTALLFGPSMHLNPWLARGLMGISMGLTAIAIIKSQWGVRSGAQFNPAITISFYRLGKIGPYDTVFYVIAHFAGAIFGVGLAAALLGGRLADPHVRYAVTVPGLGGTPAAFAAEFSMAALLLSAVLYTSNKPRLAPLTSWLVGLLISQYVLFLAPVSGFSINPARTVGSAVFADLYPSLWVYFVAPLGGMMGAAELFLRLTKPHAAVPGTRHYLTHRHLVQRNGSKSKARTTADSRRE